MFHLFEFVLSKTNKILLSPILLMNVFYNQFLKKYVAFHIQGVEWTLVHRHFTCKSKNPRILAPLIILEQSREYKSCRVLKMVSNSYFFCFLTFSGSTQ
jgi:hypothetical protein